MRLRNRPARVLKALAAAAVLGPAFVAVSQATPALAGVTDQGCPDIALSAPSAVHFQQAVTVNVTVGMDPNTYCKPPVGLPANGTVTVIQSGNNSPVAQTSVSVGYGGGTQTLTLTIPAGNLISQNPISLQATVFFTAIGGGGANATSGWTSTGVLPQCSNVSGSGTRWAYIALNCGPGMSYELSSSWCSAAGTLAIYGSVVIFSMPAGKSGWCYFGYVAYDGSGSSSAGGSFTINT